jgi:hypothetical protein
MEPQIHSQPGKRRGVSCLLPALCTETRFRLSGTVLEIPEEHRRIRKCGVIWVPAALRRALLESKGKASGSLPYHEGQQEDQHTIADKYSESHTYNRTRCPCNLCQQTNRGGVPDVEAVPYS